MTDTGRDEAGAKRREGASAAAPRRRSIALLAILGLAAALFLDGVAGERGWLANRRASERYRQVQQSLDELRAYNAALREEAWRLKHDASAIEEAARRQGMMKKGEKLFIIRDKK